MRQAVLVDDEYWTLQGMKKIFPWEKYGFQVAGAYDNALQALDAIGSQPVDLVLTDIRMPELSGLDLIRMAKERGADAMFVVISGYSEFEYARSALKQGAFDYLLKPVTCEQAEAFLERAVKALEAREQSDEKPGQVETDNEQFNDLLSYMRQHYAEHLQLKELARQFFLNPTYCSELFNKKLGISFSQYLNQLRIERCCLLLRTTARSAEEIAAQTGFADGAHFHKVFKTIVGLTPRQYREKERAQ